MAATVAASVLVLAIAKPKYEATTQLMVDTHRGDAAFSRYATVDNGFIDSQAAILKSDRIALTVIRKLALAEDPEFVAPGVVGTIASWLGLAPSADAASEQHRIQKVLSKFRRGLNVARIGHSYVAHVTFVSENAVKAARVANEVADAYIDDQLSARSAGAERAQSWTQTRLSELREVAEQSSRAVEEFRADNKLTGRDEATLESGTRAKLRDLVSNAQNHKRSYDTFLNLNRYSKTSDERSLPTTDARVISPALPPLVASSPRFGFWLLVALTVGFFVALPVAYFRQRLDGTVRSREQLEGDLQVPVVGFFPPIDDAHTSIITDPSLPDSSGGKTASSRVMRLIDNNPCGAEEILIGVRAALDASSKMAAGRIVGVTSPRNHEGKTTVAFNLAAAMAQSGAHVLLIDGDMHTGILAKLLARGRRRGITQVLAGTRTIQESSVRCRGGFQLLAESSPKPRKHPAHILSSIRMRELLTTAKMQYDYVVIDLPSALNHVDVRASASFCDNYILVAEFGRTTMNDLEAVLENSSAFTERLLGIFVNKVDPHLFNPTSYRGAKSTLSTGIAA